MWFRCKINKNSQNIRASKNNKLAASRMSICHYIPIKKSVWPTNWTWWQPEREVQIPILEICMKPWIYIVVSGQLCGYIFMKWWIYFQRLSYLRYIIPRWIQYKFVIYLKLVISMNKSRGQKLAVGVFLVCVCVLCCYQGLPAGGRLLVKSVNCNSDN